MADKKENIIPAEIEEELQERFLTYALSTIISRSLPDVRDGLKPIHRRILYAMGEGGLKSTARHVKSAKIIGDVLGKYHPHGDSSTYEAMVRMAQDFSMRYPLVDGKGNFGSMDGDSAAAYRYTEAKLNGMADLFLTEIRQGTVPFRENYDNTLTEPEVLPVKVPALLLNGSSGIAVGMACSFPPHNLREVVNVMVELIRNPSFDTDQIMDILQGPDFPTAGIIVTPKNEIKRMYEAGRGNLRVRGRWEIEDLKYGKKQVIITEIPYGVNKAKLAEGIAKLVTSKKLPQIQDIRDESTDIVRLVIEIKSDSDPEKIMAFVAKNSDFEKSFQVNFTCIEDNKPEKLSIRGIFLAFIRFRKEVVINRSNFELENLLRRLHLLDGFLAIFQDIDLAIKLIRESKSRKEANEKLQATFKIDEEQANAILDMRLYSLVGMEIATVQKEHNEKSKRVKYLRGLLADEGKINEVIIKESQEISKEFGDDRRTTFEESTIVDVSADDFIVHESITLTLSKKGWVKYVKGTVEPDKLRFRPEDELEYYLHAETSQLATFITNFGKLYSVKMLELPSGAGFGSPIQSIFKFADGEKVISLMFPDEEHYKKIMVEKISTYIAKYGKKTEALEGDLFLTSSVIDEGEDTSDEPSLFGGGETKKKEHQSAAYDIPLENKALIEERINALVKEKVIEPTMLAVHENGKGFRFALSQLGETTKTGRKFYNVKKGESLVSVQVLYTPYIVVSTEDGKLVRFKSDEVSIMNGPAAGVILMRTEGQKLNGASCVNFIDKLEINFSDGRQKTIKSTEIPFRKRGGKGKKSFLVKKGTTFTLQ